MAEYILKKDVAVGRCAPHVFPSKTYAEGWNSLMTVIENTPSVNTLDPPTAKRGLHVDDRYFCSNCKSLVHCSKYCEECGAKMVDDK